MKLAIYTRNDAGQMTYRGEQEWESIDQLFEATYGWTTKPSDFEPETYELMGWPHTEITWYGDIGIAK